MTKNYITEYVQLAYQEAVNVQQLFVDSMKSVGVKERLWVHLDALQRNLNSINEFLYHTSEVENAAEYVDFLEHGNDFCRLVKNSLKEQTYNKSTRNQIYDALMKLDNSQPFML